MPNLYMISVYLIVAVIAYLLGSIPFGYLLVRIFRGGDIRLSGSGNIGATNVARSGAKGLGIATLALDAAKGFLAVYIAFVLSFSRLNVCFSGSFYFCASRTSLMAVAALFAVLGHVFPVWLKFKGGKGVATALGVFCVLFPKAILVSLAIFILVVAVTRYVSLGSILGAISFPVAAYFLEIDSNFLSLTMASAIALIVVAKHHQNISRLLAGTENRFGGKTQPTEKKL